MSKVVVGKMVMDGCPHCTSLEKPWDELKNMLGGKADFEKEIKSDGQNDLDALNKKHGTNIKMADGFPSIFKIMNGGKVEYYEGERTATAMKNWVLEKKGGKRSSKQQSKRQSKRRNNKKRSQRRR